MNKNEVELTGIDISFWNMVCFMVKWSFASIPAAIIIGVIWITIISFGMGMLR